VDTFFLAMLTHPDCQAAAHREIDAAVGRGRLPDYDDYENLPYVNAIITEVLRWKPTTPMGLFFSPLESTIDADRTQPSRTIPRRRRNIAVGEFLLTLSCSRTPGRSCMILSFIQIRELSIQNGTSCAPLAAARGL
jgi:hypothetical protein